MLIAVKHLSLLPIQPSNHYQMKQSYYFTILPLLLMFPFTLTAQEEILGAWEGVITQDDGGYRSEYHFEMYIKKEGKLYTGRTYVETDQIFAEMALSGFVIDKTTFHFNETRIIRSRDMPQLEWCIKGGSLKLKRTYKGWELRGRWQGATDTGSCIPGEIILTKVVPKA